MSETVRTCSVCGCRVPSEAATCIYCGALLEEVAPVTEAPAGDDACARPEDVPVRSAGAPAEGKRAHSKGDPDEDIRAEDAERELFSVACCECSEAAHPHGGAHRKERNRHAARPNRSVLDGRHRRAVKIGVCIGAVVLVVLLGVAIVLAIMSDLDLKRRAEAAQAAQDEPASGRVIDIPAAGWGGSFAASDGTTLYWSSGEGIYALDAADMGKDVDARQLGTDAATGMYVVGSQLVYTCGDEVRTLPTGAEGGDSSPISLFTCGDAEQIAGFAVHGDVGYLLVQSGEPEGSPADSDDAADAGEGSDGSAASSGDGSAAGMVLLKANLASEEPAWTQVYAVEGSHGWLFDVGDQLAIMSATETTWTLAQTDYGALEDEGASAASSAFQPIAQADEQLLAAFYDGKNIYTTVRGANGTPVTARQELSGSFSDYTNVAGTPLFAGGPSLCVVLTDAGGLAWIDSQTGFLHDASELVDEAGLSVTPASGKIAVDGATVWVLSMASDGAGELVYLDCSDDSEGIVSAYGASAE